MVEERQLEPNGVVAGQCARELQAETVACHGKLQ